MPLPKKPFTPEAAYTQAAARCATAEYCLNDWRRKFQMKGLPPPDKERGSSAGGRRPRRAT